MPHQALRIATNETPYNSIANSTRGIVSPALAACHRYKSRTEIP
jgi:hypothetical protein